MPSHPPRGSPTRDNGCHAPREKAGPPERPPGHTAVSAPPAACGTEDGQPACPPGPHPRSPRCRLAAPPGRGGSPRLPAAASALGGEGGRTGRDGTRRGKARRPRPPRAPPPRADGAARPALPPPPRHTERPPVPRPAASPLRGGRASRSAPPRPGPAALRLPRPGERGARPSR